MRESMRNGLPGVGQAAAVLWIAALAWVCLAPVARGEPAADRQAAGVGRRPPGPNLPVTAIAGRPRAKTVTESGVLDGGFELGSPNPFWFEESISFATLLCTVETCGDGLGTAGPRSGGHWAWLGGFPGRESSELSQSVSLPEGDPLGLELWLWHGAESGNGQDFLRIYLDDKLLFEWVDGDSEPTAGYRQLIVPFGPLPVQDSFLLRIECKTFGPWASNFSIDDVTIRSLDAVEIPTLDSINLALLCLLLATFALRRLRQSSATC